MQTYYSSKILFTTYGLSINPLDNYRFIFNGEGMTFFSCNWFWSWFLKKCRESLTSTFCFSVVYVLGVGQMTLFPNLTGFSIFILRNVYLTSVWLFYAQNMFNLSTFYTSYMSAKIQKHVFVCCVGCCLSQTFCSLF